MKVDEYHQNYSTIPPFSQEDHHDEHDDDDEDDFDPDTLFRTMSMNRTMSLEHPAMWKREDARNAKKQEGTTTVADDGIVILRSILPTLIISILLGLVSGTLYGFGRYAKSLKQLLNLSQSQVQTLGICMDCGNYVGHPLTGLIYDRKGPIVSCLVGAAIVFFSYWRIRWTLLTNEDGDLSTNANLLLQLAFCGVGFGSGLGYISGLGSTTKTLSTPNTIQYLGTGIGMVAAGYGMSSTLVGLTFQHLPNLPSFFLFWALVVPAVNLFAATMFRMQARKNSAAVEIKANPPTKTENAPLISSCSTVEEGEEPYDSIRTEPLHALGPWNSWKTPEFWLLFTSFSCVSGCGLMVINNVSTMVESMGGTDSYAGTLILILSCANVGGRIFAGILGDSSSKWLPEMSSIRRIRLLQGVNLITFFAMMMGYLGGQRSICLTILVILVALAYGGSWVLIVALASNLFGKDHFGKDYGLLALGPALSGMVFNKASAAWYELHASDSNICMGRECYKTSYLVAGLVAMAGNLVTIILCEIVSKKNILTETERETNQRMAIKEPCSA